MRGLYLIGGKLSIEKIPYTINPAKTALKGAGMSH